MNAYKTIYWFFTGGKYKSGTHAVTMNISYVNFLKQHNKIWLWGQLFDLNQCQNVGCFAVYEAVKNACPYCGTCHCVAHTVVLTNEP